MGHAAMGEHFIRYTRENLVPALDEALEGIRADKARLAAENVREQDRAIKAA
jgi:hypothetical protein